MFFALSIGPVMALFTLFQIPRTFDASPENDISDLTLSTYPLILPPIVLIGEMRPVTIFLAADLTAARAAPPRPFAKLNTRVFPVFSITGMFFSIVEIIVNPSFATATMIFGRFFINPAASCPISFPPSAAIFG